MADLSRDGRLWQRLFCTDPRTQRQAELRVVGESQ